MKYKIKNLVIRNIKPFISGVCLIGTSIVAANSFGNYRSQEAEPGMRPETFMKLNDMANKTETELLIESLLAGEVEFEYQAPALSIEEMIENEKAKLIPNYDLDYMMETAALKKEEIEEQRQQDYIDNLITVYECGYDEVNDVEIDTENFELTTDNKTYEYLDDKDFEFFVACVAAECNGTTHDALATASSVLNRCDSERWSTVSDNPVVHLKASGQYSVYSSGLYKGCLGFNVPDDVLDACIAVWYNGVRNNNYCSFRGNSETYYSDVQVVDGGNRFGDELVLKKNYE